MNTTYTLRGFFKVITLFGTREIEVTKNGITLKSFFGRKQLNYTKIMELEQKMGSVVIEMQNGKKYIVSRIRFGNLDSLIEAYNEHQK